MTEIENLRAEIAALRLEVAALRNAVQSRPLNPIPVIGPGLYPVPTPYPRWQEPWMMPIPVTCGGGSEQ